MNSLDSDDEKQIKKIHLFIQRYFERKIKAWKKIRNWIKKLGKNYERDLAIKNNKNRMKLKRKNIFST